MTGQLDLPVVCNQFATMRYFEGIVDLCLAAATKRDPQQRAIHFYKNDEPPEDSEGCNAYLARSVYRHDRVLYTALQKHYYGFGQIFG